MNAWLVKGAAAVFAAASLVGVGYKFGRDAVIASQAKAAEERRALAAEIETRVAQRIADIRVTRTTVQGEVREIIRENTVYRDCVLDDATRRLLDAARDGRAPGADRGSMP